MPSKTFNISLITASEPWQCISKTFSPVGDNGPKKEIIITSSMRLPSLSLSLLKLTLLDLTFLQKKYFGTSNASGPLILIIAIAETPGGVAKE